MDTKLEDIKLQIGEVLTPGIDHALSQEQLTSIGANISGHFSDRLNREERAREPGKLWASDLGKPCVRQLYYEMVPPKDHEPKPEPLSVSTKVKFLYGNIVEEMILGLVKATGKYEVSGEQMRFSSSYKGWTCSGKQDCIINGHTVDVKSTSSYGFKDYNMNGLNDTNDKFGYRAQLGWYDSFNANSDKTPYFLMIDKQLGHVDVVPLLEWDRNKSSTLFKAKVDTLQLAFDNDAIPDRIEGATVPEGASGNLKLGTICSYCPSKNRCWPGLRTFLYSKGPVYLTRVMREPTALEITNAKEIIE